MHFHYRELGLRYIPEMEQPHIWLNGITGVIDMAGKSSTH